MKTQSHLKRKLTEIAGSLTGFIFANRIYLLIGLRGADSRNNRRLFHVHVLGREQLRIAPRVYG